MPIRDAELDPLGEPHRPQLAVVFAEPPNAAERWAVSVLEERAFGPRQRVIGRGLEGPRGPDSAGR